VCPNSACSALARSVCSGSSARKPVDRWISSCWEFKGAVYAKLKANICGECGYTELFVENPAGLYDAYLKAKS
jgi:hypothetical protein